MKILFLLKSHKYSGAENVILTLMQLLPDEYETYYASPDGPIKQVVKTRGQCFITLDKPNLKSVKKVIDDIEPDIIHASDFSMSILAVMASPKVPVISHLHSNPTWIKKGFDPRAILYKLALRRINKVVCVSSAIIDEFGSKELKSKAIIIPNVININRIKQLSNGNGGVSSDICLVGRLTSEKNPLFFCKIIKEIKKHQPNVKAIIIGRGELKNKVDNYIQTNKLSNNVKLIGFKANPYPYMKKAKICIMPSKYEGFGLSALEMLALGKPVIASNVGGLKTIINTTCGDLISEFNPEKYSDSYFNLINPEIYKKKAQGALLTSKKFADINLFRKRFMRIYAEAIKCQN